MPAAKLRFLPDILDEHFEELAFLWSQRRAALCSPIYTWRAFLQLEGRIEAHVQGILVVGEGALPLLEEGLRAEDPDVLFAAAYALLRSGGGRGTQLVGEAFFGSEGEKLESLREALAHGLLGNLEARLQEESAAGSPRPMSAAAAHALAFHGKLNLNAEQFNRLLRSENIEVRRGGWRAASVDVVARRSEVYREGIGDPDADIRRHALVGAAWAREAWLLDACRERVRGSKGEDHDAAYLLAILGRPEDSREILALGRNASLGPRRFRLLGSFGHPLVVEDLLSELTSADAATAAAAGAAFTKITGCDIASGSRVALAPEDGHEPDEFEKDFLDEVVLPDPEKARAHWKKIQPQFTKGTRWCRGRDLSRGCSPEDLDQLDMESRWEACLRGNFDRTWKGSALDLEVFPQRSA
ncbi:MAG TPA: hypothetical protein VMR54_11120 [Thermoanaerobaculia bacterium]|nr:hypothetical protein [Thermoanaerobaculia bacterium]